MEKLRVILNVVILSGVINHSLLAQQAKSDLSLNLGYVNKNDHLQFLQASAKTKVNGKFKPVPGLTLDFYITDEKPANALGKATTNEKGIAAIFIPLGAKDEWMKSEAPQFLVKSEPTSSFDETKATAEITKSTIKLDTSADRKIVATFLALKHGSWVPVGGVDLILAVKRLGGDLNVDQNPTHTTDSTGQASVDFGFQNMPGDSSGNIIIIAKVEENDMYGSLTKERIVPWGVSTNYVSADFNKRSLYARRGLFPLWLAFMAYGIGAAVWGVIIYLCFQIRRIKKIGSGVTTS
jgi:hypothetical protein